jgi:hypothetical protein
MHRLEWRASIIGSPTTMMRAKRIALLDSPEGCESYWDTELHRRCKLVHHNERERIMDKITWRQPCLALAVFGAAIVGCDAPGGGNGSAATGQQPKALSVAERFVAKNANTNSQLNMVALKYMNNGTEVAMFYEPSPGKVMFALGGSPLGGRSVLNHAMIAGKTASEMWGLVAPGESVPGALAQAIERSKNPAPPSQESTGESALQTPAQAIDRNSTLGPVNDARIAAAAKLGGGVISAPAPAVVQAKGEKLLSGGYCSNGGFANDWGNLGNGAQFRHRVAPGDPDSTWGWIQDGAWDNWRFTGHAEFAACPTGDVSNTGGLLSVTWPHGPTNSWWLDPDFFLVSGWILPATNLNNGTFNTGDYDCGWDWCCTPPCNSFPLCQVGGNRCTPTGSIANGRFDSDCFLNYGSSCGDHFWFIGYATGNGPSYCEYGDNWCPCKFPNDCTGA